MALKHLKTLNEELPTIEVDVDAFQNPYHKDPNFFKKGYKDGAVGDDVVKTRPVQIPANRLKPSQDAVYLGKALGLAIAGVAGGDLQAIISSDNRILDGHHRWAATILNNPKAKVGGVQAELKIGDLIQVLRQAGDALGNNRGLEPRGGDVNLFKATLKDVEDSIFTGKNMNPEFYNKEKAIEWFNRVGAENIQRSLNQIQKVSPPAAAPPRAEMPKIKPGQVDNVAKKLAGGALDVRAPYTVEAKKPGPDGSMTGLSDEDKEEKEKQMKKQSAMDDDDPNAYKEMPGDKEARKKGKVKKSKFTTAYHKKFKKNEMKNLQELDTFIDGMKAEKEAKRIEDIKNTKLNTRLKTIDEFTAEAIDVSSLDNAKYRLEKVYKHLGVEHGETYRGDKYVQIKYIPVSRPQSQQPEWVKVFYHNDKDLKKIGKELGMDLKESVEFAFDIFEGIMSNLHMLAGEAKDEDSFVKTFFKDYGDKIKKSKESEEWVRSLYKDTVQESVDEKNKGLWANIRAKRKRGEKPARKGSKAYKKAKAAADSINNEAFIGPFVFNDKMSDEELKDMYDAALDGYANYQRGFEHPKSKYKQAYQEIEKILKKRGVSVDEAFIGPFVFNDKMSDEELKDMYDAALDGYANYQRGFEHPKSKYKQAYQEIEKILKKRGVSVDEAVELVHVYKDGELYGTGELVKGKDKKIKGKKHQLIRFDGSTEDYYPAEDVKLVEAVSEAKIARKKGKTYQTGKDWTVYMSSGQASFDINVNNSAGWSTDPSDDRGETLRLLDAGKERASITFKDGNIDKVAKEMHNLTDKTTYGEKNGLSPKDYADILRVWIDMGMEMHESKENDMKKLETLENFVTEKKKQTNDQSPLSDDGMETGIKNKAKESGVPVGLLRIIMKRGLAAWKSSHRPGATQAQWGYARVNSFLTKQDGTWGGADSDIAKKVRDGGHDKKL